MSRFLYSRDFKYVSQCYAISFLSCDAKSLEDFNADREIL